MEIHNSKEQTQTVSEESEYGDVTVMTDTTYGDYARDRSKKSELRNYANYGGNFFPVEMNYVITIWIT